MGTLQFRVLLVNHETEVARIFGEKVRGEQGELVATEGVERAGHHVRDERFDVIFLNQALPNLSRTGFTRLARKSRLNSRTPIVIFTDRRQMTLGGKLESEGVTYMVKRALGVELGPFLHELRQKVAPQRRRSRRLPFRTSVVCASGSRHFRAMSVDLGEAGMLLETSLRLEPGGRLELYFTLASSEPVFHCQARAVRVGRENQVGVAFERLNVFERQRLRRFLELHLPAET